LKCSKAGPQWIGIDITSLAISLIEKRLRDSFPGIPVRSHWHAKDLEGARDLANSDNNSSCGGLSSSTPSLTRQKKGADSGIDGLIFFQDELNSARDHVSVKGGEGVSVSHSAISKAQSIARKRHRYIHHTCEHTRPMQTEAVMRRLLRVPSGHIYHKNSDPEHRRLLSVS
jgi:site-specific DNA-methyltransferase (adenine-specific)